MNNQYSTLNLMRHLFADSKSQRKLPMDSIESFEAWQTSLREKLVDSLGFSRMEKVPANPQVLEEVQEKGYRRVKVTIDTDPYSTMPFYMLVPDSQSRPLKPIIAPHGHGIGGKLGIAGVRGEYPEVDKLLDAAPKNAYGKDLVQQGYLVFCPDARGTGERREMEHSKMPGILSSSCSYINDIASALGTSLMGLWMWDIARLADYVLTLDNIVPDTLGCVGMSGGGWQALLFSAIDLRVTCTVVSGYFYGFLESHLDSHQCACNYFQNLWNLADIDELGCLVAPRPLFIENGSKDPLNGANGLANVYPFVDKVRDVMTFMGKENNLYHSVFEGKHEWNGEKVPMWLSEHF